MRQKFDFDKMKVFVQDEQQIHDTQCDCVSCDCDGGNTCD